MPTITTITIEGMTCDGCVHALHKALELTVPVYKATISFSPPRAIISYNATQITEKELCSIISDAGFIGIPIKD